MNLTDWLADTPIGKKLADERTKAITNEREEHVRALAALRKRQAEELPPLGAAVERAREKVVAAQAALGEAEGVYGDAVRRKASAVHVIDREITKRESALRETASPAIELFMTEMQALLDNARRHSPIEIETERNAWGGHSVVRSNRRAVHEWLSAVREAIAAGQALKLQVLADDELAKRLTALREGLPTIDMEPAR